MEDLETLIGNEVESAGLAERDDMGEFVGVSDTLSDEGDSSQEAAAPDVPEAEASAEGEEQKEEAPAEKPEDLDETDLELQSLGIKGKNEHGAETKIRYGRVKKIWGNYKAKFEKELTEKHQATVAPLQQQVQQFTERISDFEAGERMLQQDPARYFATMGTINPALRQFLNPALFGGQPAPNGQSSTAHSAGDDDPRPQPNATFPDGTKGYDLEGMKRLEDWNARQLERRLESKFQDKFGKPLEQMTAERRQAAERQMHADQVQKNVETARQIYGKVFEEDFGSLGAIKGSSEVLKTLRQNPGMTFLEACSRVLVPKMEASLKTDRNKLREELLAELDKAGKEKKSAARMAPGAAVGPTKGASSAEDIIREQMVANGLL